MDEQGAPGKQNKINKQKQTQKVSLQEVEAESGDIGGIERELEHVWVAPDTRRKPPATPASVWGR